MIPLIIGLVIGLIIGFGLACILASRSRDDRLAEESLFNAIKENEDELTTKF